MDGMMGDTTHINMGRRKKPRCQGIYCFRRVDEYGDEFCRVCRGRPHHVTRRPAPSNARWKLTQTKHRSTVVLTDNKSGYRRHFASVEEAREFVRTYQG